MKYSWRKSKESMMDGIDEDDDCQGDEDGQNGTEDAAPKVSKHVHFSVNDENYGENDSGPVVIEIMNDDENDTPPFTEKEAMDIWYQSFDFQRFEKDRVLTTMSYTIARRLYKNFVEDEHSLRGIEHLCDGPLQKRQAAERRDLYKSIKAEESRQKEDGIFPDLERFRSVSLKHTKASKDRAIAKASEDAREQLREMRRSASMKNLFLRQRGHSTSRKERRQSFG
jgi:hypothetical protein